MDAWMDCVMPLRSSYYHLILLNDDDDFQVKTLCERAIEAMKKRHEFVPRLRG